MEVINTNIMSLTAQNNLTKSQSSLATAMDQLSSGLRITSAASDAAGMAIATGFTTQINGLNQAIQNANNGLSLAQTAGSALSSITANLQRIRQLAVESANATNSSANRQQINQEVQQRLAEITRVASQTTFNGQHVLNGTFGQAAFQVGANVGQTITVNMTQGAKATQMGSIVTVNGGAAAASVGGTALTAGQLTLALSNGTTAAVSGSANFVGSDVYHGAGSAYAISGAINGANLQGVTSIASDNQTFGVTAVTAATAGTAASYALSINGVSVLSQSVASPTALQSLATTQDILNAVNSASGQTGVTAALNSSGKLVLSSADGGNINVSQSSANTTAATGVLATATTATTTTAATFASTVTAFTQSSTTAGTYNFLVDGTSVTMTSPLTAAGTLTLTQAVTAINSGLSTAGLSTITASTTTGTANTGTITFTDTTGKQVTLAAGTGVDGTNLTVGGLSTGSSTNGVVGAASGAAIGTAAYQGQVTLYSQQALTLTGTTAGVLTNLGFQGSAATATTINAALATGVTLANQNVDTVASSNQTILSVDAALSTINSLQATLGAVQNRFSSTIGNQTTVVQNLTQARSRIQDANFASATADLSRAQVLQQAGISILAQANQMPQLALKLLR